MENHGDRSVDNMKDPKSLGMVKGWRVKSVLFRVNNDSEVDSWVLNCRKESYQHLIYIQISL